MRPLGIEIRALCRAVDVKLVGWEHFRFGSSLMSAVNWWAAQILLATFNYQLWRRIWKSFGNGFLISVAHFKWRVNELFFPCTCWNRLYHKDWKFASRKSFRSQLLLWVVTSKIVGPIFFTKLTLNRHFWRSPTPNISYWWMQFLAKV
jgi:hypothetical protein